MLLALSLAACCLAAKFIRIKVEKGTASSASMVVAGESFSLSILAGLLSEDLRIISRSGT